MSWKDWDSLWGLLPFLLWLLLLLARGARSKSLTGSSDSTRRGTDGGHGWQRAYEPVEPGFWGTRPRVPKPGSVPRRRETPETDREATPTWLDLGEEDEEPGIQWTMDTTNREGR
jgi:hypothetical protein